MRTKFVIACWCVLVLLLPSAQGVEFTSVEIAGKRVTVCRVNTGLERLRLFLRDDSARPFRSFESIERWLQPQGRKLLFAMNAGMYHKDFSPVGLFVQGGRQLAPLNLANGEGNFFLKPNGVFLVSTSGVRVIESSEYSRLHEQIDLATQSGPLLVHNNKIHPAFNAGSKSRVLRNGVGVPSQQIALFAISEEPVNLHEFATLFRDVLHCPNALYFDGVISSLHSIELHRSDKKNELGPIIGVTDES